MPQRLGKHQREERPGGEARRHPQHDPRAEKGHHLGAAFLHPDISEGVRHVIGPGQRLRRVIVGHRQDLQPRPLGRLDAVGGVLDGQAGARRRDLRRMGPCQFPEGEDVALGIGLPLPDVLRGDDAGEAAGDAEPRQDRVDVVPERPAAEGQRDAGRVQRPDQLQGARIRLGPFADALLEGARLRLDQGGELPVVEVAPRQPVSLPEGVPVVAPHVLFHVFLPREGDPQGIEHLPERVEVQPLGVRDHPVEIEDHRFRLRKDRHRAIPPCALRQLRRSCPWWSFSCIRMVTAGHS